MARSRPMELCFGDGVEPPSSRRTALTNTRAKVVALAFSGLVLLGMSSLRPARGSSATKMATAGTLRVSTPIRRPLIYPFIPATGVGRKASITLGRSTRGAAIGLVASGEDSEFRETGTGSRNRQVALIPPPTDDTAPRWKKWRSASCLRRTDSIAFYRSSASKSPVGSPSMLTAFFSRR